ncbi:MAG: DUF2834 domain-containing protein [Acidobacteria bacterium]|nr:DUF2834 domain-containing protein [Acidobacteriota bacterium]
MNTRIAALLAVIAAFALLTALALADVGYVGIITPHFQSWGGAQVFIDLVILALLACIWIAADAPRHRLPAWPFLLVILAAGSFGLLFYLLARELRAAQAVKTPVAATPHQP